MFPYTKSLQKLSFPNILLMLFPSSFLSDHSRVLSALSSKDEEAMDMLLSKEQRDTSKNVQLTPQMLGMEEFPEGTNSLQVILFNPCKKYP